MVNVSRNLYEFVTLLETNIFAPENGWLEYFLVLFLGPGKFSGAFAVSFGRVVFFLVKGLYTHRIHETADLYGKMM